MMKIVVVDRRADLRSALKLLINELLGSEVVVEASSISEIKGELRQNIVDLILIDWGVLCKNTKGIMAEIRNYNPDVKIVVIDSNEDTKQNAIAAGADDFVSKDYPPDRLLALLNRICLKEGQADISTVC